MKTIKRFHTVHYSYRPILTGEHTLCDDCYKKVAHIYDKGKEGPYTYVVVSHATGGCENEHHDWPLPPSS